MQIVIETLLVLLYLFLLINIIRKFSFFKIEGLHKNLITCILLAKVVLGSILVLIYTYYYPDRLKADVFKYFDDSKVMFDALLHKPIDYFQMLFGIKNDAPHFDTYYTQMNNWYRQYETNIYNDSHIIIRFNAFVRLFSFGYLGVHTVLMSFIAILGQTALYKFIKQNSALKPIYIAVCVFLIPSVMFWTSGVLKEGLLFFGLGFFLYFSYKLIYGFNFKNLIWVSFSVILLVYLKFYIIASVFPLLLVHYWLIKTRQNYVLLKYGIVLISFITLGFNLHHFFPNYNLVEIMVNKQNDFIHLAHNEQSGSLFNSELIKADFVLILKKTPQALFKTFFIPHIFMKQNTLSYIASIENMLFLLLLLFTLFHFKTKNTFDSFYFFCFFFTLITFILLGLTTPVYGALVRYKTPALPFLLAFIFMNIDTEKAKNRFNKIKKIVKP